MIKKCAVYVIYIYIQKCKNEDLYNFTILFVKLYIIINKWRGKIIFFILNE